MVTRLQDIVDTAQRRRRATARPWIQGETGDIVLNFKDSDDNAVDLTGYSLTCAIRYFTGTVSETGEGTDDDPLVSEITDLERISGKADDSLSVVFDTDRTTGIVRTTIPSDLYDDEIDPNLESNVPVVVLYFTLTRSASAGGSVSKFRHMIYLRDGGP